MQQTDTFSPKPLSRLDAKIARKGLLEENCYQLWSDLWSAVERTREKLNEEYSANLSTNLNGDSTLIAICAPRRRTKDQFTIIHPFIEIAGSLVEKEVSVRYSEAVDRRRWHDPIIFTIKPDLERKALRLESKSVSYSPIELAEVLLAEKMLGLNLDSI